MHACLMAKGHKVYFVGRAGTSQEAAVDPVAALTDANIAVETRSVYPSPCDIPPATATKRVAPPDP